MAIENGLRQNQSAFMCSTSQEWNFIFYKHLFECSILRNVCFNSIADRTWLHTKLIMQWSMESLTYVINFQDYLKCPNVISTTKYSCTFYALRFCTYRRIPRAFQILPGYRPSLPEFQKRKYHPCPLSSHKMTLIIPPLLNFRATLIVLGFLRFHLLLFLLLRVTLRRVSSTHLKFLQEFSHQGTPLPLLTPLDQVDLHPHKRRATLQNGDEY